MREIKLKEHIITAMIKPIKAIINCSHDIIVLKGGRSSTKSQAVAIALVIVVMMFRTSCIAIVKYNNKVKDRLVDTVSEAIRILGVQKYWKLKKSPYKYVLLDKRGRETNISIKFVGSDNPDDIKSYRADEGSFRIVWFEEAATFKSYMDILSIIDTMGRGSGKHVAVLTYNPPKKQSSWVNKEFNAPCGTAIGFCADDFEKNIEYTDESGNVKRLSIYIHHSTYLDVIADGHIDWLGSLFIGNANKAMQENPKFYQWNYLGAVVGTDANVFDNVVVWDGDKDKLDIREIHRGLDHGLGGPDPSAYIEVYFDSSNRYLYVLDEFGGPKLSIDTVAQEIRKRNPHNFMVNAESATPILNNQLRHKGINVINVKKKPDSVRGGIQWLQDLNGIFICPGLTPQAYKEFTEYEYEVDKDDQVIPELVDKNNHFIDATRYALVNKIKFN